ncbi:hypothetical protein LRP52_47115 [Photobacterium sp. ZSDE20]|uniref:Uncharacterized protein n=1 Tax=Photobacterium pectinilyticum TaxID=2906793 RepID=A0ABT1NBR9_9GAMM|nr:hypothetical protein [Photobacterium sp. ZSDE20]MCQ1061259.1 hypothetical protein [Photobacterium sp. ZSDE20]MDD1829727.1 hypothetical protein [Photobacterium sp. ZSDE20]
MILNRIFTYFLCFFIVYTPFRPVKAFVPLVPAVVALTGQAALWTGRQLITRMAVNYGTQAGVVATAAVATTPLIKDYMESDYALKPWGSWAYLLGKAGFISEDGALSIDDHHCYQDSSCGNQYGWSMANGQDATDFDAGLFKTNMKLDFDCPTTESVQVDEDGRSTLYDCGTAISRTWHDKHGFRGQVSVEPQCNTSWETPDGYVTKHCYSNHRIDVWAMTADSLILSGEKWVDITVNGSNRIVNKQPISEIQLIFPEQKTEEELFDEALEVVLEDQLVGDELPIDMVTDNDLNYCVDDNCYSLPQEHFLDNTVVIPVDENDIPTPEAVGGSPVSLPSGRPLPPISDPIYADAINSGLTGVPTGDPDTDAIVEDLIKPIFDAPAPIVQQPTVNPPITNPPVQGSAVTVSNLSGIETRLDTVNNTLSSLNVDVDLSGVENRIDRTNALIEGLSTSTVPINLVPDKGQASSFWESRYPDGFAGVWNNYNNNLQNTALVGWVDSFKLTYASDGIPSWSMCFDLGFVDFGCHVIDIDSRVWLAIRAFILFTSVMLARRLVFGG